MKTLSAAMCVALCFLGCAHQRDASNLGRPEVTHHGDRYVIAPAELDAVIATANAGETGAMMHLMRYYHWCLHDTPRAVPWAKKAAEAGLIEGKLWLGVLLFYDDADHENDAEAIRWMREAAEAGDAEAKSLLIEMETEANQRVDPTSVRAPRNPGGFSED